MSGFNYHTGYIPGVVEEEMHKRRLKIRIFLIVSVIALALFWLSQPDETIVTPAETIPVNSPQNTVNINKLKKDQQDITVAPVTTNIEKASVIVNTGNNTEKSESVSEVPNTYEKDIDAILEKAFSTNKEPL